MAGSIKSFEYKADDGKTYMIRMDASNALAVGNKETTNQPAVPVGLSPRKAHFRIYDSGTKRVHVRSVVIGDPASQYIKGPGKTAGLIIWQESGGAKGIWKNTGYTGEKRTWS